MNPIYRVAIIVCILALIPVTAEAQSLYNERVLRAIGLNQSEIDSVLEVTEDAAAETQRLNADLEIKKAELARILLDDSPSVRQIERNLRDTAEIEVQIRLVEIQRELAVREAVGADRWATIIQSLRVRRAQAATEIEAQSAAFRERLAALQEEIVATQRTLLEAVDSEEAEARVREEMRQIQVRFRELLEGIQDRVGE